MFLVWRQETNEVLPKLSFALSPPSDFPVNNWEVLTVQFREQIFWSKLFQIESCLHWNSFTSLTSYEKFCGWTLWISSRNNSNRKHFARRVHELRVQEKVSGTELQIFFQTFKWVAKIGPNFDFSFNTRTTILLNLLNRRNAGITGRVPFVHYLLPFCVLYLKDFSESVNRKEVFIQFIQSGCEQVSITVYEGIITCHRLQKGSCQGRAEATRTFSFNRHVPFLHWNYLFCSCIFIYTQYVYIFSYVHMYVRLI